MLQLLFCASSDVFYRLNAARRKALIELGYAKSPTPAAIAAFAAEL